MRRRRCLLRHRGDCSSERRVVVRCSSRSRQIVRDPRPLPHRFPMGFLWAPGAGGSRFGTPQWQSGSLLLLRPNFILPRKLAKGRNDRLRQTFCSTSLDLKTASIPSLTAPFRSKWSGGKALNVSPSLSFVPCSLVLYCSLAQNTEPFGRIDFWAYSRGGRRSRPNHS